MVFSLLFDCAMTGRGGGGAGCLEGDDTIGLARGGREQEEEEAHLVAVFFFTSVACRQIHSVS